MDLPAVVRVAGLNMDPCRPNTGSLYLHERDDIHPIRAQQRRLGNVHCQQADWHWTPADEVYLVIPDFPDKDNSDDPVVSVVLTGTTGNSTWYRAHNGVSEFVTPDIETRETARYPSFRWADGILHESFGHPSANLFNDTTDSDLASVYTRHGIFDVAAAANLGEDVVDQSLDWRVIPSHLVVTAPQPSGGANVVLDASPPPRDRANLVWTPAETPPNDPHFLDLFSRISSGLLNVFDNNIAIGQELRTDLLEAAPRLSYGTQLQITAHIEDRSAQRTNQNVVFFVGIMAGAVAALGVAALQALFSSDRADSERGAKTPPKHDL
jgi:hypothetical protein